MGRDMSDLDATGHAAQLAEAPPAPQRWVYGYGSLMWRPGFAYVHRLPAVLHGRRRAFCIYSVHHRGTPERPGLVLGLARGGAVRGAAYEIAPENWDAVLDYLREREQPTETYVESRVAVRLCDGRRVQAVTFLSDTDHPQWAGELSFEAQARLIARSHGLSGANVDYLADLVEHLRAEGVRDRTMERLLVRVRELQHTAAVAD
ncbi:MAG TPA: gamma-glutamylcyclotransferase [Caulobacteraceae bacterium]|jgi:cation transport protein ChaC|nr:gamma-glutamylcyclotransferase [Caulobacteraceae bacterium]